MHQQNEEAERKASRLKDMELRRQQAMQKKVDEEKAREQKKAKEENERWKREKEKENNTEKRALRLPGKKVCSEFEGSSLRSDPLEIKLAQPEEDASKKRQQGDADKKTEPKQAPSKDKKEALASKLGKFVPSSSHTATHAPANALKNATQSTHLMKSTTVKATATMEVKTVMPSTSKDKGKGKEVETVVPTPAKQKTKVAQAQMQARYQAQLTEQEVAKLDPGPTDGIELPDIDSEYSNSDDEDRVKTFDPPVWAQSPALREKLESQSQINPDNIFGPIKTLKMEELFKTRTSRFRARTSSANWAGTDELTAYEEKEYAKRMGFKQ